MFVDDLFDKKTLTENHGGGSPWHADPEQGMAEAGYRRDAYQRDYDNSVAGMGKRQSRAYQDDGGANDERHDLDPSDWYVVKDGKMFKVTVYPNQVQSAMSQGFSPSREEAKAKAAQSGVAESVRDLGYDAQSLIMKLRRDVEEKRLQPTRQAVLAAASELAGDMDFAPELLVQQVLGKGITEGEQDSPVAGAIIRRILLQRTDLLSKYGPEKVGAAVDEVADFVGDTDEIGSSDVSGWVRQVEQTLGNMGEQGVAEGSQRVDSLVSDALKIMRGPEVSDAVAALKTVLGDREFNGRRGFYNFYIKQMLDMYGQQGVMESQLDELSFKDIQRSANKFAKGTNKFTKNVADTGAAVGNAAGALGGAIKQVGKTAIADPVAATYNATKSGLGKVSNVAANTYGDLKKGVQTVGKAGQTVGSDIGAAGTEVGKGIQSVGRGVANVAGGTTGALGSVVGGATTGLGRAAARGFNTGVQNVGGDAIDKMQTNIMTPKAADIQKQIATKQDEIKALQATLAGEQSAATTGGKAGIQTGATALIDPETNRPYEKDKLASLYGYKEPEAAAAGNTAPQATAPVGFNASNLSNLPGMQNYKKPAAPAKTANFGGPGGYGKTTTGIKAPAAPSSPALAAPTLPAAPKVTAGGPTPAEKANLDKRIAAAAPAVAETLEQIDRMLESVNSKKSAEMVKAYVDQRFTELGLRNTTECRNLMARVVQESAIRRRQHAKSLAK